MCRTATQRRGTMALVRTAAAVSVTPVAAAAMRAGWVAANRRVAVEMPRRGMAAAAVGVAAVAEAVIDENGLWPSIYLGKLLSKMKKASRCADWLFV